MGGKHSMHIEVDDVRDRILAEMDDFFQKYKTPVVTASALPPGIAADGEGCNGDAQCMSRNCDAHYGFDIFGGKCKPLPTFVNAAPMSSVLFAMPLLFVALLIALF